MDRRYWDAYVGRLVLYVSTTLQRVPLRREDERHAAIQWRYFREQMTRYDGEDDEDAASYVPRQVLNVLRLVPPCNLVRALFAAGNFPEAWYAFTADGANGETIRPLAFPWAGRRSALVQFEYDKYIEATPLGHALASRWNDPFDPSNPDGRTVHEMLQYMIDTLCTEPGARARRIYESATEMADCGVFAAVGCMLAETGDLSVYSNVDAAARCLVLWRDVVPVARSMRYVRRNLNRALNTHISLDVAHYVANDLTLLHDTRTLLAHRNFETYGDALATVSDIHYTDAHLAVTGREHFEDDGPPLAQDVMARINLGATSTLEPVMADLKDGIEMHDYTMDWIVKHIFNTPVIYHALMLPATFVSSRSDLPEYESADEWAFHVVHLQGEEERVVPSTRGLREAVPAEQWPPVLRALKRYSMRVYEAIGQWDTDRPPATVESMHVADPVRYIDREVRSAALYAHMSTNAVLELQRMMTRHYDASYARALQSRDAWDYITAVRIVARVIRNGGGTPNMVALGRRHAIAAMEAYFVPNGDALLHIPFELATASTLTDGIASLHTLVVDRTFEPGGDEVTTLMGEFMARRPHDLE